MKKRTELRELNWTIRKCRHSWFGQVNQQLYNDVVEKSGQTKN